MIMDEAVGFWRRSGAFLLDILIINLIIIYPFRGIFSNYFGKLSFARSMALASQAIPSNVYWALFFISVLALLYFTFFDYYLGQTLGQMILKIKSISLKSDDGRIDMWTAILRNCFVMPFFPFYIFWIVDPIYLAFYKERFLEKISATKTVYTEEIRHFGAKRYSERYKLDKVK